jgi:hypothetical protein
MQLRHRRGRKQFGHARQTKDGLVVNWQAPFDVAKSGRALPADAVVAPHRRAHSWHPTDRDQIVQQPL